MATVTDDEPASSDSATASRRRAALIATGLAVPVTVVLAFLFTAGSSSTSSSSNKPLPAVTIAAPPTPSDAITQACTSVFEKLPVQLAGQNPRRTDSDSGFVAAWGNPAIIIRCGVPKPVTTGGGNDEQPQFVNNEVLWHVNLTKNAAIYTTIDRPVYIEVTVPAGQTQNQPLPLLSDAVAAIPAVCTGIDGAGNQTPGLPVCPGAG